MGATGVATMLALGFGSTLWPAFVAGCLTVAAGLLSLSRLRPSLRNPTAHETNVAQPGGHGDVGAA
jgi:MFS transporter, DHA2 family, multidrug resistance protein